jgi:glycosyltransferase involved in cell wall biosynthesis
MRVGVIVAARGPAPFLAEALGSVGAADEIVVVDHASEPPLSELSGARLVRLNCAAGGPAAARDAGLSAVSACDLVALCDADDVWERGKLEAQLGALAASPEAAVVFGRATVIDARGRPTGERLPELGPGLHEASALRARLFEANPIPASSAVIRREALEGVGGFAAGGEPLPAASDWDLWLRLVAAGHAFLCEPAARIRYRRHAGGLTSDVSRLAEGALAVHARHADLVDATLARRVRARDLELLARGRIRERRYADARRALREAAELAQPRPRERMLRVAAALPGVRAALGRRRPFP